MDLDFKPENAPPQPTGSVNLPGSTQASKPVVAQPAVDPGSGTAAPQPLEPPIPTSPPPKKKSFLALLLILLAVVVIAGGVFAYFQFFNQSSSLFSSQTTPTQTESAAVLPSENEESSALPSTTTPAGRDSQRKEDLKKIQPMIEAYFTDNKSYPIAAAVEKLNDPTSSIVKTLVPNYGTSLPSDPLDPDFWYGYQSLDGKTYELSARLENIKDSQAQLVGSKYIYYLKK